MVFTSGFGLVFAGIMNGHTTQAGIVDTSGMARTVIIYNTDAENSKNFMTAPTKQWQIGKGITPPTPLDFNIETPMGSAPESGIQTLAVANYIIDSGTITQTGFISNLGSSDSFTEICFYTSLKDSGGTQRTIMISRVLVSPPQAFLAGNRLDIEHLVNI